MELRYGDLWIQIDPATIAVIVYVLELIARHALENDFLLTIT